MGRVPLAERTPFIILLKLPVGTVNVRGAPAVTVRLILKRAELDLRAISCMQFKRVDWNVRNCPKRSYAGAIANCEPEPPYRYQDCVSTPLMTATAWNVVIPAEHAPSSRGT
jgi:hypothetical protein